VDENQSGEGSYESVPVRALPEGSIEESDDTDCYSMTYKQVAFEAAGTDCEGIGR